MSRATARSKRIAPDAPFLTLGQLMESHESGFARQWPRPLAAVGSRVDDPAKALILSNAGGAFAGVLRRWTFLRNCNARWYASAGFDRDGPRLEIVCHRWCIGISTDRPSFDWSRIERKLSGVLGRCLLHEGCEDPILGAACWADFLATHAPTWPEELGETTPAGGVRNRLNP